MKIRKQFVWLRSVAALTMVSMLLLGCASDGSMNRTQKGAAIGGASGAAVGGLIGSKKGKTGKGAVIGGVAGAVLGGFVGQYMDRQAKELEQVAETERVDDGIIVTMKDKILFDFNSADLKASSRTSLQKMADVFKNYEKTNLTVTGHRQRWLGGFQPEIIRAPRQGGGRLFDESGRAPCAHAHHGLRLRAAGGEQ